jgi:hypothetical protein
MVVRHGKYGSAKIILAIEIGNKTISGRHFFAVPFY